MRLLVQLIVLLLAATVGRAAQLSPIIHYRGMCDASGAVAIDEDTFVVADDEDNKLRLYHARTGGSPVKVLDVSGFLRVDPKEPELDLEGAARIGDRIYWITSHGRNKNAKYRESRLRFFATSVQKTTNGFEIKPVGKFYSQLLADLFTSPKLRPFRLAEAAQHAPKDPGGFNIEGLSATPEGQLLVGFRNPIPRGRALLVPLLNPADVVTGSFAKLGDPIQLDLGGRGIRAIALHEGKFIIAASAFDAHRDARLYFWDGKETKPAPLAVDLHKFNPEALIVYPTERAFQILSDDGTLDIKGSPCKSSDPAKRNFRGAWVTP
jgi:hypothetical protein